MWAWAYYGRCRAPINGSECGFDVRHFDALANLVRNALADLTSFSLGGGFDLTLPALVGTFAGLDVPSFHCRTHEVDEESHSGTSDTTPYTWTPDQPLGRFSIGRPM